MAATTALDALAADRDELLRICGTLPDTAWRAPTGCAGWTVQDLVAHLGGLFWLVVDPTTLPSVEGLPTETAQEVIVEARRAWSVTQVLDDYASVSATGLDRLRSLAAVDVEVALGDLGTYPASALPKAYAFDHFTHIRADLFAPSGPLDGPPPAADADRADAAIDWIDLAVSQQNPDAIDALPGSVELVVEDLSRVVMIGSGPVVATVRADAFSFVLWVTQRARWDERDAVATGDPSALAIVRRLHVF
jgi:uncharacterized protein (TIGR03083 family)